MSEWITDLDDMTCKGRKLAASLHESFAAVASLEAISEAVDREFARYSDAPVKEFVPLLVEHAIGARLRALESDNARSSRAPVDRSEQVFRERRGRRPLHE